MVIVIIQAPNDPNVMIHVENAANPQQVLAALQSAANTVIQQTTGPKVLLPNGQAHIVPPAPPTTT